ncbi:MAG: ribonucleoside-diphosphate reductase subunit alpha [Thermomicrobiales bacterium]|nr:ribonucleoside-diphosphate reductase subunit alpha [Thermomicrobiales bacterium]MCO5219285.1 ribonucleoside-diphosphate reductase subunit alpha [Thermomicrobiales bacterium]
MAGVLTAAAVQSVRKRDGRVVAYTRDRIAHAIEMAWRAELGVPFPDALDAGEANRIEAVADAVEARLPEIVDAENAVDVEAIQDIVEQQLMIAGAHTVARRYILYRDARARARQGATIRLKDADDNEMLVNRSVIREWLEDAAGEVGPEIDRDDIEREVMASIRDGMKLAELDRAIVLAGRARIERRLVYGTFTARALLRTVYSDVVGRRVGVRDAETFYADTFVKNIPFGVEQELLAPEMLGFNLSKLAAALKPERDLKFRYLGLQTLYDRYLIHHRQRRIELPQAFWMRVAMGLALAEKPAERDDRAIEFYEMLSTFRVCSSSPTLFNAGTRHPQLSSCFLTSVEDDLAHIFKSVSDNALLSKWSGGLGNDWTNVRALGSRIHGTNGQSHGIVPFLKVVNDAAVAVNQGGKRKGAVAAYLEVWHSDILEFLDLRKNSGDDRRRTHDMHTAAWVPDLFMERVQANGNWTLFSPSDVPDLHHLYGDAFRVRYEEYERDAANGLIPNSRAMPAVELWRRILSATFETGHPWLTFKDPSNLRSPQDHAGVVHNSNLCTEILLNTSIDEVAVCNLASINLPTHMVDGQLDREMLGASVTTAMRMLDNVIDINFYPIPEAENANQKHRPVGIGMMGFQDCLWQLGISYASAEAMEFADTSMELISWHAIIASAKLAGERGTYSSYPGSKWDRDILPIDSLELVDAQRQSPVEVNRDTRLDWQPVRAAIRQHGMRNSNTMAIAPTATIANIQGVTQSIEPLFTNLFVKSNLSGEFTIVNESLIADLEAQDLWDDDMLAELKYWDGSIAAIERIPEHIRMAYPTAFEIEPEWLIEAAARRQKWIDQGQSLNLYIAEPNGKRLNDMYMQAWLSGLKTTYYLRSRGATQNEKSTIDINRFGLQPRWMKHASASARVSVQRDDDQPTSPSVASGFTPRG